MNKVITINLNGRAFLLEEGGYEKLQTYLQDSRGRLGQDPDKEEIIKDLEQAVAEKFGRFLTAGKTVVLEKEVDEVIKEMGQVEGGQKTDDNAAASSETPKRNRLAQTPLPCFRRRNVPRSMHGSGRLL